MRFFRARVECPDPASYCTRCDAETWSCDECGDDWESLQLAEDEVVYCAEGKHYCKECTREKRVSK